MKFDSFRIKYDKGVAGLTILLSLVTMLFVIGFLIMIFALMGSGIQDSSTVKAGESTSATQSNLPLNDTTYTTLTACNNANQGAGASYSIAYNDSLVINSANFTFSGCTVRVVGTSTFNNTYLDNLTYTFTYAGTSWEVINETTSGISGVTDWFNIFIVIGAMVVLILLTVIIITAIRGSGLMAGSSASRGTGGSA